MKKIKDGEYKLAVCFECKEKAYWRASRHGIRMFSCERHAAKIVEAEKALDDDHMTEADHQTWGRP